MRRSAAIQGHLTAGLNRRKPNRARRDGGCAERQKGEIGERAEDPRGVDGDRDGPDQEESLRGRECSLNEGDVWQSGFARPSTASSFGTTVVSARSFRQLSGMGLRLGEVGPTPYSRVTSAPMLDGGGGDDWNVREGLGESLDQLSMESVYRMARHNTAGRNVDPALRQSDIIVGVPQDVRESGSPRTDKARMCSTRTGGPLSLSAPMRVSSPSAAGSIRPSPGCRCGSSRLFCCSDPQYSHKAIHGNLYRSPVANHVAGILWAYRSYCPMRRIAQCTSTIIASHTRLVIPSR